MRLIDADALEYKQQVMYKKGDSDEVFAEWFITATEINNAPTINVIPKWIPCEKELPNENEIFYNGVGIDNERDVSDRVLAIDSDGFIRTGYFIKSCSPHEYYGKGIRNKYSSPGIAEWDFGEHYMGDPNNWVCGSGLDIVAWMSLPKPYTERSK